MGFWLSSHPTAAVPKSCVSGEATAGQPLQIVPNLLPRFRAGPDRVIVPQGRRRHAGRREPGRGRPRTRRLGRGRTPSARSLPLLQRVSLDAPRHRHPKATDQPKKVRPRAPPLTPSRETVLRTGGAPWTVTSSQTPRACHPAPRPLNPNPPRVRPTGRSHFP